MTSRDAYLTIVSRRDTRTYAETPLGREAQDRLLHAARVSGSAKNEQRWRFHVLETRSALEHAARGVTRPDNLLGAPVAISITSTGGSWGPFDAGRAAQSIMLAAAADGLVSCPNAVKDHAVFEELLDLRDGERVVVTVTVGHPRRPRDPEARTAAEWAASADRLPLEELVRRY